jgi:hypothetical protein
MSKIDATPDRQNRQEARRKILKNRRLSEPILLTCAYLLPLARGTEVSSARNLDQGRLKIRCEFRWQSRDEYARPNPSAPAFSCARRQRTGNKQNGKGGLGDGHLTTATSATRIGSLASRIWVDPLRDACFGSAGAGWFPWFSPENSMDGSHCLNFSIFWSLSALCALHWLALY